jgi:hypothetical protein
MGSVAKASGKQEVVEVPGFEPYVHYKAKSLSDVGLIDS